MSSKSAGQIRTGARALIKNMKKTIFPLISVPLIFLFSATAALAASVDFSQNMPSVRSAGQLLSNTQGYLNAVAGTIAVVFIIIGAAMYMMSMGGKDTAERAKKTIMYAVGGLAIVVAAPVFWKEISNVLGGNPSGIATTSSAVRIAMNVLGLLLSIAGSLAIIGLIVGGIWMFSAAGDEGRLKSGKAAVKYSLLGIVIAVGALVIAQQIVQLMGG